MAMGYTIDSYPRGASSSSSVESVDHQDGKVDADGDIEQ